MGYGYTKGNNPLTFNFLHREAPAFAIDYFVANTSVCLPPDAGNGEWTPIDNYWLSIYVRSMHGFNWIRLLWEVFSWAGERILSASDDNPNRSTSPNKARFW